MYAELRSIAVLSRQGQGNYFPINEYAYNTLSTEPDDQFETF